MMVSAVPGQPYARNHRALAYGMNKKIKTWLPISFFVGGFLLAYGGWKLSLPIMINLGLLPFGVGVVIFGIDAIQKKESSYTDGGEKTSLHYTYHGFAAVMDGLVLSLLGIGILGYALIALLGQQNNIQFIFSAPKTSHGNDKDVTQQDLSVF
jgi:hypothetical protein